MDRMKNFQFDIDQKLTSFDVSSSCTKVPLEETRQLITESI